MGYMQEKNPPECNIQAGLHMVRQMGLDSRLRARSVAALTPHRGVIHYRSLASPLLAEKYRAPPKGDALYLVRQMGLEPSLVTTMHDFYNHL